MDKNSIVGFLLIAAVFFGYFYFSKPTEEQLASQKRYQDSIAHVQNLQTEKEKKTVQQKGGQTAEVASFVASSSTDSASASQKTADTLASAKTGKEQIVTLENEQVKIDFSTLGGKMIRAQLKDHKRFDGTPLFLFNVNDADFGISLKNKNGAEFKTSDKNFTPILSGDKKSLTMRLNLSEAQYIDFIYNLQPNSSMMKYDINMVGLAEVLSRDNSEYIQVDWSSKLPRQEKGDTFEKKYSHLSYKFVGGDVDALSDSKSESKDIPDPLKWIAFKNQYFTTTLISDNNLSNVTLSTKPIESENYIKDYGASFYSPVSVNGKNISTGFRFYLGPVDYSKLRALDKDVKDKDQQLDMDKLVPLGWTLFRWVNQYFVIPLFNLLSSWGFSVGIIILLMTIIVKLILAPFTFKAFMSSAKMRVLRPQIQTINEKYPNKDQMMERQKATMDLYGRAGVSPMGGCLPMLLQMPILLALFSFFPSAIELRQHSFLWAHDLSAYDAIVSWNSNIPVITSWFGNHISLFCLLMTVTNVVYMKFSMEQQDTGQQQIPGMKMMMYMMPLMMLFVLNKYPSGLTYYYFISTLITILLTVGFRYFVDEDKVLAKLEENKKKPRKKKSGFMARLEEAQRMQQQQARQQPKGKGGGNNKGRK